MAPSALEPQASQQAEQAADQEAQQGGALAAEVKSADLLTLVGDGLNHHVGQ